MIFGPIEGQNSADLTQKRISCEHSPNKCKQPVLIVLCEYFFQIAVRNHQFK